MAENVIAKKLFISGRVQGVGFRWFAKRVGDRLGLQGYVRNLYDGRVETWVQGNPAAVDSFSREMAKGPGYSKVTGVEHVDVDPRSDFDGFLITF